MKLFLNALEVECIIGELPHERIAPQRLSVDVEMTVGDRAAFSDSLDDAVDYAALSSRVREALVAAECRMIERAARLVVETCLAESGVLSVTAKVTKSGAVEGLGSASAVWEAGK
jgi:dihydroneopterin aldolase